MASLKNDGIILMVSQHLLFLLEIEQPRHNHLFLE
jgi:hypothetical protein